MVHAVVFDMDGVLFDTERLFLEAGRELTADGKWEHADEAAMGCIGLNMQDTKALFLRLCGEDFPFETYHKACAQRVSERIEKEGLPLKKGVKELLAYLKEAGYKIALASSTSQSGVLKHLERAGLREYFSVVIGGDMIEHGKPAPDIYLRACAELGVAPDDAFAVEDSANGIRSAYSAGLSTIMVPDLIVPTPEIEKLLYAKYDSLLDVREHLMTQKNIKEIWYEQLARDYSCTVEELKSAATVFAKKAYHPKRRIFRGDDCFLKILVIDGKLVVNADDEAFLIKNRSFFENISAAWFFEPEYMRALDKLLAPYGQEVADFHHFYLPGKSTAVNQKPDGGLQIAKTAAGKSTSAAKAAENTGKFLRWYEKEELEIFRGDGRFGEALSFLAQSPDVLAVTWEEKGEILGMAGASADADEMWQIGINVLPGGEHRGMGTLLVTRLKEEILKRDKVPFYGTAQSHIRSQRVAVQSGFVPAWAELYSRVKKGL